MENVIVMKIFSRLIAVIAGLVCMAAASAQEHVIPFEEGRLTLTPLQDNAARIRYSEGEVKELPEWIYTEPAGKVRCRKIVKGGKHRAPRSGQAICIRKIR